MTRPLSLQVITLHADGVSVDSDKRYNWNDKLDRGRLTKHLHWAFHNSRRVAIEPLSWRDTQEANFTVTSVIHPDKSIHEA